MIKASFISTKFSPFIYVFLLTLTGTTIGLLDATVTKATESRSSSQPPRIIFNLPPKGAPGSRGEAGSRDKCPQAVKEMTALVPANNSGQTLSDRPSFWFYIPYSETSESKIIFELQDSKQNSQTAILSFQKIPGVVQIPFPKTFSPLKSGQRYRWKLTYLCNQSTSDNLKSVEGAIDKIIRSDSTEEKLKRASSIYQKSKIYADNGIWFDLLNLLSKKDQKLSVQEDQKKILYELFNQSPEIDLANFVENFYPVSLPK